MKSDSAYHIIHNKKTIGKLLPGPCYLPRRPATPKRQRGEPAGVLREHFGFTLIEVLVVIFLFTIISLVILNLFSGQNKIYKTQTAELNINAGARAALDDIGNSVRIANLTLSSYGSFTAGPAVLILRAQSVNASNQLLPGVFDIFVFYLSGSNLLREVFPDATSARQSGIKHLASNVISLVFTYNNVDYAQVTKVDTSLTITELNSAQNRTISISSTSRLRNH